MIASTADAAKRLLLRITHEMVCELMDGEEGGCVEGSGVDATSRLRQAQRQTTSDGSRFLSQNVKEGRRREG